MSSLAVTPTPSTPTVGRTPVVIGLVTLALVALAAVVLPRVTTSTGVAGAGVPAALSGARADDALDRALVRAARAGSTVSGAASPVPSSVVAQQVPAAALGGIGLGKLDALAREVLADPAVPAAVVPSTEQQQVGGRQGSYPWTPSATGAGATTVGGGRSLSSVTTALRKPLVLD